MPGFNRRQLFKIRLGDLSREAGKAMSSTGSEEEQEQPFARPPGALESEDDFLNTCERCGACAAACPHQIVRKFGPTFGPLEDTPFLEPESAPCHWCEDMPCIEACPSGALRRDDPVPPIAKVSLDRDQCLNSIGTLCDTCSYRCPSHIRAIRMARRFPVVDLERCTGCGMCVYHCEAEPTAFTIVNSDSSPNGQ